MDFVTDLPPSKIAKGKVYNRILVVVDRLTKYVAYFVVNMHITALDCVELLWRELWSRVGIPKSIVSDRDPRFKSAF
jgi:hypothetical protein